MRATLAIAVSAAAAAACAADAPTVSTSVSEIRFGTPATVGQYPQVVALVVDQGRRGLCTGTLVAPDVVLTAAHCVDPGTLGYGNQQQVTAATMVVLDDVDLQAAPAGRVIAAADTRAYPAFDRPGDPDVGLVFLAEQVTDRPFAALNHDPAAMSVGTAVDLVGFGETESGSFGRLLFATGKPSVSCTSFGVSDGDFICLDQSSGSGICSGDSGGPAFATIDGVQRVVGITSFGDQNCTILGAHMRVDAAVTRTFLRDNAPQLLCRSDGVCDATCTDAPDPDCRVACTGDDGCADGEYCAPDGFCAPEPYSPGGVGTECEGPADCASGLCAQNGGELRCVDACTVGGAACADGFDCLDAGGTGVCWPAEDSGGICAASGGRHGAGTLALIALAGVLAVTGRRRRR